MNTLNKTSIKLILGMLALMSASCQQDINYAAEGAKINTVTYIYEVRDAYNDPITKLDKEALNGAYYTTGVVISDATEKNIPEDWLIIQAIDAKSTNVNNKRSAGLILEIDGITIGNYSVGDSVTVDLRGCSLQKENGNLVVKNVKMSNIQVIKTGVAVSPKTLTLSDLYSKFESYQNMLVSINADITPLPQNNESLAGSKSLIVSGDSILHLTTNENADFADNRLMPSAQFTGITFTNDAKKELRIRSSNDMQNGCGPVYNNWPEDFEWPSIKELGLVAKGGTIPQSMTSYNSGDNLGILKTGTWYLYQSILVDPEIAGTLGRDRISGIQGIRMQQQLSEDGYLQMNFDVLKGASKVTFTYGSYYNDASSTFGLEYSKDEGDIWKLAGEWNSNPTKAMQVATYMLNISGRVRFRIVKKGLGPTSTADGVYNGRLSIDNIYIYQNEW